MKILLITLFILSTILIATEPDKSNQNPLDGMVYVPAGSFIMGSKYGDPDERPQQIANTDAYFIDKYEVSNLEYSKFDQDFSYKKGKENNAAIVNWNQANNYAKWMSKRLPTEKEWEKAARGTDGRVFPWGNTYNKTFVVWDQRHPRGSAIAKPESPYGCYDMAGSVWEWTSDWYKPYSGNNVPMEQYGETYKVMRGGSNFNNYSFIRTSQRYYLLPDKISRYFVGFRCVKDIN